MIIIKQEARLILKRNLELRLVTKVQNQTQDTCQGSSNPNWNTGQVRIWEPEGCLDIRSGA